MCSHQLKIVSYEIEFIYLLLWRFFVIQVDVFSSVLLWIKSRIARANNKMGVHWRHASFELFACTFRAMHATNFVHIKDHSVCRFVVRHRHRSLVNNSPFWCKHRRTHTPIQLNRIVLCRAVLCSYSVHAQRIAVTHFALKFKPYCLRWARVLAGKHSSDVCYLASVNDANLKWKATSLNENRKTKSCL